MMLSPPPPSSSISRPPRVSVIMPMYNAGAFVAQTLDSVLAQTMCDIEVIVVDDGSTDDSVAVAAAYASKPGSVVRLLQQPNAGPSRARNTALGAARGEFAALLDSDDLWMPTYLARTVGFLDANPDVSLVFTDSILFGEGNKVGKRWISLHPSVPPYTAESLIDRSCNVPSNNVLRRSILERTGCFDETLRASEDWDLWIRLVLDGVRIDSIPEPLHRYRQHAGSISASEERLGIGIASVCRKLQHDDRLGVAARTKLKAQQRVAGELIARHRARQCLLQGDYIGSRAALAEARSLAPSARRALLQLGLRVAPGLVRRVATRS